METNKALELGLEWAEKRMATELTELDKEYILTGIKLSLVKNCSIPVVMPRTFSKEVLKKAYIQGYRKRAINGELKYDEISEQYAIKEFNNWFENLYEA